MDAAEFRKLYTAYTLAIEEHMSLWRAANAGDDRAQARLAASAVNVSKWHDEFIAASQLFMGSGARN